MAMSSLVPKCHGHFGTSADMFGQFGTGAEVSYGSLVSWVRSVLGPKCLDTQFSTLVVIILQQMLFNTK